MPAKIDSLMKRNDEQIKFYCPTCGSELDVNCLLEKYGPEGLYDLSDKLRSVADEDVSDALGQPHQQ